LGETASHLAWRGMKYPEVAARMPRLIVTLAHPFHVNVRSRLTDMYAPVRPGFFLRLDRLASRDYYLIDRTIN
jgi:hypothetical protein